MASNGNDANACTRTAPCRTFNAALAAVAPGGEVLVLDTAGYGPFTVTKSATISGPSGVYAGIAAGATPSAPDGVTINAAPSDRILLKGLSFNGLVSSNNGITVTSAGTVSVENCIFNGFNGKGISGGGGSELYVSDTSIRQCNGGGVSVTTAFALLDRVRIEDSGTSASGIGVASLSGSQFMARDSSVAGSGKGFASSGGSKLTLVNGVSTHNGVGIVADGAGSAVEVSRSKISYNTVGVSESNGGTVTGDSASSLSMNDTDGAFTTVVASFVDLSTDQTIGGHKTFTQTINGSITGNAGSVTNGVYTTGNQTIGGLKTFSQPLTAQGTFTFVDQLLSNTNSLELLAGGNRLYRLQNVTTTGKDGLSGPNLIGGYSGNAVTSGAVGASIGGGGSAGTDPNTSHVYLNRVTDDYGTVGGGVENLAGNNAGSTQDAPYATVGGGLGNTASGQNATVGGGIANTANSLDATVGGGLSNTASGSFSTVGGGLSNSVSGFFATVGGGNTNSATKVYATVPGGDTNTASGQSATVSGGSNNTASGDYSFASGRRAKAAHQGAFVWGDSTDADVSSTANNEFTVRATGGVRWFTNGSLQGVTLDGNGVLHFTNPSGGITFPDNTTQSSAVNPANVVDLTTNQTIGGTKTFSQPITGNISGNAGTVTNGVYTTGDQTLGGNKTFSNPILGSINGNAVTVTNGVYTTGDQTIAGNKTFSQPVTLLDQLKSSSNSLELLAGGNRLYRLENVTSTGVNGWSGPNLIGGYQGNSVTSGAVGITLAGGGGSGIANRVTDDFDTVGGGVMNRAGDDAGTTQDAPYATVGGGQSNAASSQAATVSGGKSNTASGNYSNVSGGFGNTASGFYATVSGGNSNTVIGQLGTVAGGVNNKASNDFATVSGGNGNTASGTYSSVSGGTINTASGFYDTVSGGFQNMASGGSSTVSGGEVNTASGVNATVSGGENNTASGNWSFAAGRKASATHDGSFVWSDSIGDNLNSSAPNEFTVRATGGIRLLTNGSLQGVTIDTNGVLHLTNPSGGIVFHDGTTQSSAVNTSAFVDLTNPQTIGGTKTFSQTIAGSINGNAETVTNGVYTTGDQTLGGNKTFSNTILGSINGNAGTVSDGVYITGDQTIGGVKTFSQTITGNISGSAGSAATVTNGVYTTGDQTIDGSKTFSQTITGDISGNAGTVTNGVYTNGDQTIDGAVTLKDQLKSSTNSLELLAGGNRLYRLENVTTNGSNGQPSPNLIGGSSSNVVILGVVGASIGGGGSPGFDSINFRDYANRVTDEFGTVAGGVENRAGDESPDTTDAHYATVGGGFGNVASGPSSIVGGGFQNTASGQESTVSGGINNAAGFRSTAGGGIENTANGEAATISGGEFNSAHGLASTVSGGEGNAASGDYSFAAGRHAQAVDNGSFVWADSSDVTVSSNGANTFTARATGGVQFISAIDGDGNPTAGVTLVAGSGAWSSLSDRNMKNHFQSLDPQTILDKLANLPITEWSYKAQDPSIRHMGPMAQDFSAAFGLGEDDRHISTIDEDGVMMAALQGLVQQGKAKDARIAEQQGQITSLEKKNADMEARLARLERLLTKTSR